MEKLCNTTNYTGFCLLIFRGIIQIFKNTLFYAYKISEKKKKAMNFGRLATLVVLALIEIIKYQNRIEYYKFLEAVIRFHYQFVKRISENSILQDLEVTSRN